MFSSNIKNRPQHPSDFIAAPWGALVTVWRPGPRSLSLNEHSPCCKPPREVSSSTIVLVTEDKTDTRKVKGLAQGHQAELRLTRAKWGQNPCSSPPHSSVDRGPGFKSRLRYSLAVRPFTDFQSLWSFICCLCTLGSYFANRHSF